LKLRRNILDNALFGRHFGVQLTEHDSGQWASLAYSHGGLDNAMTTSREGYGYLSSKYRYQPIFRNGKLPPNEENIFSFSFRRRESPGASAAYAFVFGHW
jgi:hypothetical protein